LATSPPITTATQQHNEAPMSYDPIAAIIRRNQSVQEARAAHTPEVGIWWIIDNQLIADSIPYTDASEEVGFRAGPNDHFQFFATLQKLEPGLRHSEYTDAPRGRVIYDVTQQQFLCYGSKQFASSPAQQRLILDTFRLPADRSQFIPDLHYEDPNAAIFG